MIFSVDEKYTNIYDYFTNNNNVKKIDTRTLFLLAASIGFKHSRKSSLEKKGKETRASFLKVDEENLIFNMAYSDEIFSNDLEKLAQNDKDNLPKIKKIYEEYANGGMEVLIEEVFKDNWNGYELNNDYSKYYYDLARFILIETKAAPF